MSFNSLHYQNLTAPSDMRDLGLQPFGAPLCPLIGWFQQVFPHAVASDTLYETVFFLFRGLSRNRICPAAWNVPNCLTGTLMGHGIPLHISWSFYWKKLTIRQFKAHYCSSCGAKSSTTKRHGSPLVCVTCFAILHAGCSDRRGQRMGHQEQPVDQNAPADRRNVPDDVICVSEVD